MITNTKNNPHPEWVLGGNPRAIELQEKVGQMELSKSQQLPRKSYDGEVIPIYEKLGIKIMESDKEKDPLFISVVLPKGWKIVPTEHSMYSNLIDSMNRKRASIFYKAAFYDRDASISFNKRFNFEIITYSEEINNKYSDFYERKNHTHLFGRVLDGDKVLFETEHTLFKEKYNVNNAKRWWENYDKLQKSKSEECRKWLNERYPEWNSIYTHW